MRIRMRLLSILLVVSFCLFEVSWAAPPINTLRIQRSADGEGGEQSGEPLPENFIPLTVSMYKEAMYHLLKRVNHSEHAIKEFGVEAGKVFVDTSNVDPEKFDELLRQWNELGNVVGRAFDSSAETLGRLMLGLFVNGVDFTESNVCGEFKNVQLNYDNDELTDEEKRKEVADMILADNQCLRNEMLDLANIPNYKMYKNGSMDEVQATNMVFDLGQGLHLLFLNGKRILHKVEGALRAIDPKDVSHESQESQGSQESQESQGSQESQESQGSQESQESEESEEEDADIKRILRLFRRVLTAKRAGGGGHGNGGQGQAGGHGGHSQGGQGQAGGHEGHSQGGQGQAGEHGGQSQGGGHEQQCGISEEKDDGADDEHEGGLTRKQFFDAIDYVTYLVEYLEEKFGGMAKKFGVDDLGHEDPRETIQDWRHLMYEASGTISCQLKVLSKVMIGLYFNFKAQEITERDSCVTRIAPFSETFDPDTPKPFLDSLEETLVDFVNCFKILEEKADDIKIQLGANDKITEEAALDLARRLFIELHLDRLTAFRFAMPMDAAMHTLGEHFAKNTQTRELKREEKELLQLLEKRLDRLD